MLRLISRLEPVFFFVVNEEWLHNFDSYRKGENMRFLLSESLEVGMILARDIVSPGNSFMLKKGVTLTEEYIGYLIEKGYLGAYVNDENSKDIEVEDPISQQTLLEGVKAVENTDIDGLMVSAHQIVADISKMEKVSIDILDLRSFDDYTYHHSVNVAVYAVAVGMYLGMSEEELVRMSLAGVCHDLGKQKIPLEIINKPGKLTDEEFAEIKNHPKYSYDILYGNPEIPPDVRQAVICHHENENGSGYPFGKEGNELTMMTKILHAVDVYDALISRRPYKIPYAPVEAFEYLLGGVDILFNRQVVEAMQKVIPAYPLGMEVYLSTGERALVVGHSSDPFRPVVRTIADRKYMDLSLGLYKNILILSGDGARNQSKAVEKLNEERQAVKDRTLDIMVVDDSPLSLQQTSTALGDDGYHLIVLQSGLAAINYIKTKGAPDLIIMDIEMPTLNGLSTVSSIRSMGYENLPIIFLTSKNDRETVMKCRAVNAKDYIIKPVRPAYLRARVAIALDASLER